MHRTIAKAFQNYCLVSGGGRTVMTGRSTRSVEIRDIPLPRWVAAAIRRARRREPDPEFPWPTDAAGCVLAVRLARSRRSLLGSASGVGVLGIAVDDEAVATVLPLPLFRSGAVAFPPGRHTFTVVGSEEQESVRPVTVETRAGTVVAVDVHPSRWARDGHQPLAVAFRVAPSGLTQRSIKNAVTKPVRTAGLVRRLLKAAAARADDGDESPADSPGPASADDGATSAGPPGVVSPVARTWIGRAWRRPDLLVMLIPFAGLVVFGLLAVLWQWNRDQWVGMPSQLPPIAAFACLLLLAVVAAMVPHRLSVDPEKVTLNEPYQHVAIALADIAWVIGSWQGKTLLVAPRPDTRDRPKRTMRLDLRNFSGTQRKEICRLLSPFGDSSSEIPTTATLPYSIPSWTEASAPKSWVSRSGLIARTLLWVLVVCWVLFLVGLTGPLFPDDPTPWPVLFVFWASLVPLVALMLWATRQFRRITLTLDATGLRIERTWRPCSIAYSDIASFTAHTTTAGNTDTTYVNVLIIEPKPSYYARTNSRPPGRLTPQWRIGRYRFTQNQFDEIQSYLAQAVVAAGGTYYPG